jgi:hypothetical protein
MGILALRKNGTVCSLIVEHSGNRAELGLLSPRQEIAYRTLLILLSVETARPYFRETFL